MPPLFRCFRLFQPARRPQQQRRCRRYGSGTKQKKAPSFAPRPAPGRKAVRKAHPKGRAERRPRLRKTPGPLSPKLWRKPPSQQNSPPLRARDPFSQRSNAVPHQKKPSRQNEGFSRFPGSYQCSAGRVPYEALSPACLGIKLFMAFKTRSLGVKTSRVRPSFGWVRTA